MTIIIASTDTISLYIIYSQKCAQIHFNSSSDKLKATWNLPVLRDMVRRLPNDPVAIRSSPATDIYVVHFWLIGPNKLNYFCGC